MSVAPALATALAHAFAITRERGLPGGRPTPRALARAVRTAVDIGAIGRRSTWSAPSWDSRRG
jgi:hypothetical protein